MKYTVYKLNFKTPVHFGNGRLTSSSDAIYADTLFSALYKESLKLWGKSEADKLYNYCLNGEIVLSDMMPYSEDTYYIPKPIVPVKGNNDGNSVIKKKFKNLKYIPLYDLSEFISGNYIPNDTVSFGLSQLKTSVVVNNLTDNEPYNIGTFTFNKKYGLYFIVKASEEGAELLSDIMDSLSYTGIGGRLSSGLGRFDYSYTDLEYKLEERLEKESDTYMSLSVSMADENELVNIIEGASYTLIKRSGFIASETYGDTPLKKQDFYCFKSGSCFKQKFKGNIFDVSNQGRHSVYRYLKPMFIGL